MPERDGYFHFPEGDERDPVALPMVWEICETCQGNGKHSHALGAITSEEWARDWDFDEREQYMAGFYDQPCTDCHATGKVHVVDYERFERDHPDLSKMLEAEIDEELAYKRMGRAEREMGA